MLSPAEILSSAEVCQNVIKDFSCRQQQVDMAKAIEHAFIERTSLICEAGTGIGKTFAYLLPAILSGQKVIISTGTRHLQDQIFEKDLPVILQLTRQSVNTAMLKGRINYLCLHRLDQLGQEPDMLPNNKHNAIRNILEWSYQTTGGDLSEIPDLPEDSDLHRDITSTTEQCLGQACSFFDECFVFKARKKALEADLIITNHHVVFADLKLKEEGYSELLPRIDAIIFDEAHHLPRLASEFFSEMLGYRKVKDLFKDSMDAYLKDANDMPAFTDVLHDAEMKLKAFHYALTRKEGRISWTELIDSTEILTAKAALSDSLYTLEKNLEILSDRGRQLQNCWIRCSQILDYINTFGERENPEMIQWLDLSRSGFVLYQTPLDISRDFQGRLSAHHCFCVYTSATLAVNEDFSHFASKLGLEDIPATCFDSPFDYMRQTLLYLPGGMPLPNDNGYTEKAVKAALPVIEITQGHTFFLFTSYQALYIAEKLIRNQTDFPLFIQGTAPRSELLENFRKTEHAILMGTSSFWEGVDVRGTALSSVIIDKLPFTTPDDPVFKARAARMETMGINPFIHYQLPEAIISLRQGIGRLIRDVNDYGVLMICDPRITRKNYGKKFIKSLPEMTITSSLTDVEDFFYSHYDN